MARFKSTDTALESHSLRLSADAPAAQRRAASGPGAEPAHAGLRLRELHLQLRCFKVNDDARTFLSWRSEEASLALSPEVTAAVGQVPSPLHPAPNFEDSDAEQPASYAAPPLSESSVEAVPTWSEEGTAPGPVCTASPEHSMTPSLVCTATPLSDQCFWDCSHSS